MSYFEPFKERFYLARNGSIQSYGEKKGQGELETSPKAVPIFVRHKSTYSEGVSRHQRQMRRLKIQQIRAHSR